MTSPSHVTVKPEPEHPVVQPLSSADPPWLVKLMRLVAGAGTSEAHWTFVAGGQEMLMHPVANEGADRNGAARKLSAANRMSLCERARNEPRRGPSKFVGRWLPLSAGEQMA